MRSFRREAGFLKRWTTPQALPQPKTQQQAELLKKPGKEKEITQELRQQEFDNKLTTDDHGMHVIGKYKGYLYASYPFVAYKTTSVMIHKDALPKDLKKKLGIK